MNVVVYCSSQENLGEDYEMMAQAVGNMEAVNVLSAGSFGSQTMEQAVTRADAAQMLSAAKTLLDGEKPGGMFGWRINHLLLQNPDSFITEFIRERQMK